MNVKVAINHFMMKQNNEKNKNKNDIKYLFSNLSYSLRKKKKNYNSSISQYGMLRGFLWYVVWYDNNILGGPLIMCQIHTLRHALSATLISSVNGSVYTQCSLWSIQSKLPFPALQGYHSHVHLILSGIWYIVIIIKPIHGMFWWMNEWLYILVYIYRYIVASVALYGMICDILWYT